jgi:hypothetical protein
MSENGDGNMSRHILRLRAGIYGKESVRMAEDGGLKLCQRHLKYILTTEL